jgi:hypothetical protein
MYLNVHMRVGLPNPLDVETANNSAKGAGDFVQVDEISYGLIHKPLIVVVERKARAAVKSVSGQVHLY